MFRSLHLVLLCLSALVAAPAFAQVDPLEEEAGLLDGDPLMEKKAAPAKVLADPDAKLLKKVEAAQADIEKTINGLQQAGRNLQKISEGLDGVSQKLLKAMDGYLEQHNAALDAYRTAIADGKKGDQKKAAKTVIKLRKTYLKKLSKVGKAAAKLKKQADKLAAKVKEEDAEKQVAEDDEEGGEEGAEDDK